MVSPKLTNISATVDGAVVESKNIIPFTTETDLHVTDKSGFQKIILKTGADFRKEISNYLKFKDNLIVFVDPSFSQIFTRLNRMRQLLFKSDKSVVFVLGTFPGETFDISVKQEVIEQQGANVVGVIPGKSKNEEMVIFSGHYDHIGIDNNGGTDSIYNGANDDASGITAIIEMARYYKALNNNERTLIFAAFTAEEIGGFGSQFFSKQVGCRKSSGNV